MFFIWGSFSNRKGLLIGAKNGDTKKINSRDFIGLGMGYSSNMYIYIIYAYIHYNIYMAMLMDKMMINHWIWGDSSHIFGWMVYFGCSNWAGDVLF